MTLSIIDQDIAVAALLKTNGISYQCNHLHFDKPDQVDRFSVSFFKTGSSFTLDFTQGIGLRIDLRDNVKRAFPNIRNLSLAENRTLKALSDLTGLDKVIWGNEVKGHKPSMYAVAPTQASVLYCLLSDAMCADDSFEEFCDNCGYDHDSRKALTVYIECQTQATKLKACLGTKLLEEIQEALQDY